MPIRQRTAAAEYFIERRISLSRTALSVTIVLGTGVAACTFRHTLIPRLISATAQLPAIVLPVRVTVTGMAAESLDGSLMELTHVTIVNNTAKREGGGLHLGIRNNDRDEKAGATFHIRNSILANNSQGNNNDVGNDCDRDERGWATNVGNLIENPGDCGAGDALRADPLLGSLTGSPGYYPLLAGSPAIDAASSAYCTRKDQRGQARRITDCDIGAYEWSSGLVYAPKPPVRSIIALLPEIEVSDLTGFTEAQRIDAEGVGIQSVIDRGIVDAVDVWGFMGAGTRVCFLASGGRFQLPQCRDFATDCQ